MKQEHWRNLRGILMVGALVFLAHAPSINNGFISDDYVILERVQSWLRDWRLFSIPAEGIRLTSYAVFALLHAALGYRPALFYLFAILFHLLNVLLLRQLLRRAGGNETLAWSAALMFGVVQNPQEAVWWLAGMSDTLVGTFILSSLLAWGRRRYTAATILAALAMASKDSGLLLLVLVPLLDFAAEGRFRLRPRYALLLIPAAGHLALFASTAAANSYLNYGLYAVRPAAAITWLNTMHRMAFPWTYFLVLASLVLRCRPSAREWTVPAVWAATALLPYIFITFQNHVPSRNQYPAAIGLCWLMAVLSAQIRPQKWRQAFLGIFILSNIVYLWAAKDKQYVIRAAPTEQLLVELRRLTPQCVSVARFPYNPWVAKDAALLVPGWRAELIRAGEPAPPDCLHLTWDSGTARYLSTPP